LPDRVCCTHRGAVVALDLRTGATKWRYDVIDEAEQGPFPQALIDELASVETFGPSGGDVWSAPTYDAHSKTVFVSTGQLFSRAPDGSGPEGHDAVIALDARTGAQKWVRNLSTNIDVFRFDIPFFDPVSGEYFDKDMSDHPKVYKLQGRTVVGAGQKSGEYHVLDAATGSVVTTTQHIDMIIGEGGFHSGRGRGVRRHRDGAERGRHRRRVGAHAARLTAVRRPRRGQRRRVLPVAVRRVAGNAERATYVGAVRGRRQDRRDQEARCLRRLARRQRARGVARAHLRGLRQCVRVRACDRSAGRRRRMPWLASRLLKLGTPWQFSTDKP
jgi:hypothetical protein